jgi:hypothetical protein
MVNYLSDADPKICPTAIAGIDAAGGRLPLWIVCVEKIRSENATEKMRLSKKPFKEPDWCCRTTRTDGKVQRWHASISPDSITTIAISQPHCCGMCSLHIDAAMQNSSPCSQTANSSSYHHRGMMTIGGLAKM